MAKRIGNNEGSITHRKDGLWQAQITVGRDAEGKLKRVTFYGKTRSEVQSKLLDAQGKVMNGTFTEPLKLTFGEWLDYWLNSCMKVTLRLTTWDSYKVQVDKHIKPVLGNIKLTKLKTSDLQKLYNDKLKGGRADGKGNGLAPKSVRYIHTIAHSALQQALKERLISINPADAVKLPKVEKKEMSILDQEQIKKFFEAAKDSRYNACFLLDFSTGLRRGELLGIRWKDIDLKNHTISVRQQLVRTSEGLMSNEPKTQLSRRTINLPESIAKVLKAHKTKQNIEKLEAGSSYEDQDLVFCSEIGKPIDPRSFTRHFEKLLKAADIPSVRFHDIRHTFATLSLEQGISARTIQEILGHYSPAFSMSQYSHVTAKMKQDASDKIGSILGDCISTDSVKEESSIYDVKGDFSPCKNSIAV